MIYKTTSRILQETEFIEQLLLKAVEREEPTHDDDLNQHLRSLMSEEVPQRAADFAISLTQIADGMTFDDWNDFWLDMGIRIYKDETDWETYHLDEDDADAESDV